MTGAARGWQGDKGDSLVDEVFTTNEPTNESLTNQDFWLDTSALAGLADVSERAVQKAIQTRRWRGSDLLVREESSNVGRGGKVLRVHVDSLPSDLRTAWYLARGIDLHGRVDPATGRVVADQALADDVRDDARHDARHAARLAVARWRHDVIRQVLALPVRSAAHPAGVC